MHVRNLERPFSIEFVYDQEISTSKMGVVLVSRFLNIYTSTLLHIKESKCLNEVNFKQCLKFFFFLELNFLIIEILSRAVWVNEAEGKTLLYWCIFIFYSFNKSFSTIDTSIHQYQINHILCHLVIFMQYTK